ncbi:polyvinylalcohol dehydrogenase [Allostella sp. ATCC 35155]|nr:polyvinylalcohol dehydrogenase [Stella sp. ATCC 35155]
MDIIAAHEDEIIRQWQAELASNGSERRLSAREIETQCRSMLDAFRESAEAGQASERLHDLLAGMTRTRALQGFPISETVSFVLSLKRPLADAAIKALERQPAAALREVMAAGDLIDGLVRNVTEAFARAREEIILHQQQEISELSTPVVKLWDGILALPLIGTLDSSRTQVVMENLLQAIVDEGAQMTIIDITGVPTVDTLVAQHLLKTIAAARLMGAECIISGIRPQIAQTMVHLGVELSVVSKATLAEALGYALAQSGRAVVARRPAGG